MDGRGVGVIAGRTTAVGLGGRLLVVPGHATTTTMATTRAAATPERTPTRILIRLAMS
jgi:hypothetical protein